MLLFSFLFIPHRHCTKLGPFLHVSRTLLLGSDSVCYQGLLPTSQVALMNPSFSQPLLLEIEGRRKREVTLPLPLDVLGTPLLFVIFPHAYSL